MPAFNVRPPRPICADSKSLAARYGSSLRRLRAFSILQILREEGHNVMLGADREKLEHVGFFGSKQELDQYEIIFERLNIEVLYVIAAV
jgi:hypothetical protein